jgi:hypothetical protein
MPPDPCEGPRDTEWLSLSAEKRRTLNWIRPALLRLVKVARWPRWLNRCPRTVASAGLTPRKQAWEMSNNMNALLKEYKWALDVALGLLMGYGATLLLAVATRMESPFSWDSLGGFTFAFIFALFAPFISITQDWLLLPAILLLGTCWYFSMAMLKTLRPFALGAIVVAWEILGAYAAQHIAV